MYIYILSGRTAGGGGDEVANDVAQDFEGERLNELIRMISVRENAQDKY